MYPTYLYFYYYYYYNYKNRVLSCFQTRPLNSVCASFSLSTHLIISLHIKLYWWTFLNLFFSPFIITPLIEVVFLSLIERAVASVRSHFFSRARLLICFAHHILQESSKLVKFCIAISNYGKANFGSFFNKSLQFNYTSFLIFFC